MRPSSSETLKPDINRCGASGARVPIGSTADPSTQGNAWFLLLPSANRTLARPHHVDRVGDDGVHAPSQKALDRLEIVGRVSHHPIACLMRRTDEHSVELAIVRIECDAAEP